MGGRIHLKLFVYVLLSVACLQLIYQHRPRGICPDATFSLFAAQNFADRGLLQAVNSGTLSGSDLSKIKLEWLTTWPPLVSLAFAVLLKAGLTPGLATDFIVFALILMGSYGWVLFFEKAGTNRLALLFLAALIPWTSFPAWAWTFFLNDHVVWALAPWGFLLLLSLPETPHVTARDFRWRLPLAGLACGLLVIAKYSAFPLVIGAGIYFFLRDGRFCSGQKVIQFSWFTFFLILPGAILYFINHALTGETTAQIRTHPSFFAIGIHQIWNVVGQPMKEISGWEDIDMRTGKGHLKHYLIAFLTLLIWIGVGWGYLSRKVTQISARTFVLLWVMTAATWLFLIGVTMAWGYRYDWTTQARLSFPIIFGWFCLAIALVFEVQNPFFLRTWLLALCGVPLVAAVLISAARPFLGIPPGVAPESRLAATPSQCSAYLFLESMLANGERRPDLIIAESPEAMNELKVPMVHWYFLEPFPELHSSKPMVAWALMNEVRLRELRGHLDNSVNVRAVPLPPASPWQLLVLEFTSKGGNELETIIW